MIQKKVLGMMSGTSLDGLDLACAEFKWTGNGFAYKLLSCETIPYTMQWKQKLSEAFHSSEEDIQKLSIEYGKYLGESANDFLRRHQESVQLIGSHGHTVFHKPDQGITLQIGDGKQIFSQTGIPVICNFRQQDVQLGGQGAPLVPVGDELLFGEYDFCLNLGGFANVSWKESGKRRACDISVCNLLLNLWSRHLGKEYDDQGAFAKQGTVIPELLQEWDSLEFYNKPAPKSLGREWFETHFPESALYPKYPVVDILKTATVHIASQIAHVLDGIRPRLPGSSGQLRKVLCTGGGAHNKFLISLLEDMTCLRHVMCVPDSRLIDYKEAFLFGFLAFLKDLGHNNVLASVTGARMDHSSGDRYGGQ